MSYRRTPFAVGEWYHCYTRGVEKRTTFEETRDYERFIQLLYLANDIKPIQRPLFEHRSLSEILQLPRKSPIVAIAAYCLMPNHFHILIQEIVEGGITRFMRKLGTGYTMYFNVRNARVGNLFVKPFRSKHINNEMYLRQVAQYIHLNPTEIFEPSWKQGTVTNFRTLQKKLTAYSHSSFSDYLSTKQPRIQRNILDTELFNLIRADLPPIRSLLVQTAAYYKGTNI